MWWEVSFPEPQSLAAVPPPPALVSRVPSPLQTLQIWARASAPAPQVCARGAPNACWAPVGARQTRGARTGRGDTGTGPRAPAHPRPQPQRPLGRSDPPGRGAPEQPLSFPRPQEARVPFPTGSRGGPASFPALQVSSPEEEGASGVGALAVSPAALAYLPGRPGSRAPRRGARGWGRGLRRRLGGSPR